jgi:hypothetical protein
MIPKYYTKLFIEHHEDTEYKDYINNIVYNLWVMHNVAGAGGKLARIIIKQLKRFSDEERNRYYLRMYEVYRRDK